MEEQMFIALARFPDVAAQIDEEFREWFVWSNEMVTDIAGLKRRRLLRTPEGAYAALVEHDSAETFAAMHTTEAAAQIQSALRRILTKAPEATQYEVVADLQTDSCCGGATRHHGDHDARGNGPELGGS